MIQATANRVEKLWIILLAAGGSARLGRPKQLLRFRGQTLFSRALQSGSRISGRQVIVVIGADAPRMRSHVRRHAPHARVVFNADWQSGMGTSLAAAIKELPRTARAVMVLLSDQPRVSVRALHRLSRRYGHGGGNVIVASRYRGRCGVPAIFPRRAFRTLAKLDGDLGARALLNSRDSAFRVVPVDLPEAEYDIDTPADAAALFGGF
jgi:molybdenum cofactor cytidylyltransferase